MNNKRKLENKFIPNKTVKPMTSRANSQEIQNHVFIVFGLIAPIGCKKDIFFNYLNDNQEKFNFEIAKTIKFSQLDYLKQFIDSKKNQKKSQFIDIGNELREKTKNNAILAIKAITEIIGILRKNKNDTNKTQVFIISSLKHNDEVELLKNTFGTNLFLIGLNSSEERRKINLQDSNKDELIKRDKNEEIKNGQQLDKIFKKCHFFVNMDDVDVFDEKMERFFNLIHGHPFCTPEPDELLMSNAYLSSARSASINRQVGAVIINKDNEIISTGCNEVPKFGGGHYWPTDKNDAREFKRMEKSESTIDSNNRIKEEIATHISNSDEIPDDLKSIVKDLSKKHLESTEYFREEHAEQAAISSCVRHGISTLGCKLYCTTLPCHNCIRIIVSAGIKQVIYIEPYSKSKIDLYDDSITFLNEENKVKFTQFEGVGPGRFLDLFSVSLSSGYDLKRSNENKNEKTLRIWKKSKKIPRIPSNNLANIILKFLDELDINGIKNEDYKFNNFVKIINENIEELKKIKENINLPFKNS